MSNDFITQWRNEQSRADARKANIEADHANRMTQIAQDDADSADRNSTFFEKMTGTLFESMKVLKDNVTTLQNRIAEKNKEINKLKEKIDMLEAENEGIKKQRDSWKSYVSEDCVLFKNSNKISTEGKVKRNIRIIFEEAFDNALSRKGYKNPTDYRTD